MFLETFHYILQDSEKNEYSDFTSGRLRRGTASVKEGKEFWPLTLGNLDRRNCRDDAGGGVANKFAEWMVYQDDNK